jgi:hypothetical protein
VGAAPTVPKRNHPAPRVTPQQKVKLLMQICVSVIVLFFGIAILTSPNAIFAHNIDESTKKWAAGWIGVVIGYWLS